jgi:hypothetical protein
LRAITEFKKQWNMKCEKLVEFQRKNGHCMVPFKYEQEKSLGTWVNTQRIRHANNKIRLDRKTILEEIGFAWKADVDHNFIRNDQIWQKQYEKMGRI